MVQSAHAALFSSFVYFQTLLISKKLFPHGGNNKMVMSVISCLMSHLKQQNVDLQALHGSYLFLNVTLY